MGFDSYHPTINLIYFVGILGAAIVFRQPVFLAISYLGAFAYSVRRNGRRALAFNLCLIPLILAFALYYSSYHHFGITILSRNFIGNNMTMEAALCGLTIGVSIAAVVMWLGCVVSIFTADKVVYLLGAVSPRLSLYLAILLRIVPRLKQQARKIATARSAIGRGLHQGNFFRRLRNSIGIFSMLVTWLLESLSTISDSMRSRGSGLRGRTAFSIYRFDHRDRALVMGLFACLTGAWMAYLLGETAIVFDPRIILKPITALSVVFYFVFGVLCLLPLMLEIWTEYRFQKMRNAT